jgi:DNA-directed RNA polymerase specialized sigma24 family protein
MQDRNLPDLYISATFPSMPFLRREWNISPEAFDAFLAWLDPDRVKAGNRYEDIRRRLIKIFASRGCSCPEDLADETINRVIVKARELIADYRGDPALYFCGVARNVFHEYTRRRAAQAVQPAPDPPESREQELDCLDKCLKEIPMGNRTLILRYYEGEKGSRIRNRNTMARELGTEANALRIRAHRIRTILQQCVGDCIAQRAG